MADIEIDAKLANDIMDELLSYADEAEKAAAKLELFINNLGVVWSGENADAIIVAMTAGRDEYKALAHDIKGTAIRLGKTVETLTSSSQARYDEEVRLAEEKQRLAEEQYVRDINDPAWRAKAYGLDQPQPVKPF